LTERTCKRSGCEKKWKSCEKHGKECELRW
jgi:hypothetical protein